MISAKNRSLLWMAARLVLMAVVIAAIVVSWNNGVPWAMLGFSAFVLALLYFDTIAGDRRRHRDGEQVGPVPRRRKSDR